MKYIIMMLVLAFSAQAWELGIGAGGLTQHFTIKKHDYCRKLNNYGTILNRAGYIRYRNNDRLWTVAFGEDSVCSEIFGAFYGFPMADFGERHRFYWLFGAYTNKYSNWQTAKARTPEGFDEVSVFTLNFDGFRVVPIAAIEYNFVLWENQHWLISLNSMLSLFISHHGLYLQRRF